MPEEVRNLLDLSGKVSVVTGASRGIGKGIVKVLASAGSKVIVHFHSHQSEAQQVVDDIRQAGGEAILCQANITSQTDVLRLIKTSIDHFHKIDFLVNNAGIYPTTSLIDMTSEQWDSTIDSNLRSVFLCTQAAAKAMIEQKSGGSIINIASIEGNFPAPNHCHYNASKAGVIMFTKASARELAPYSIRVNAVSPGLIWTPGIEENWEEGVVAWKQKTPLKRLGIPEDIANACLFLVSPLASWITGINLVVDGGASTTPSF